MLNPHKYIMMSLLDFINLNSPIVPRKILYGNDYVHFTFTEGEVNTFSALKVTILMTIRLVWYVYLLGVVFAIVKNIKNWQKYSWPVIFILFVNIVYTAIHAQPRYSVSLQAFYMIFFSFTFIYFVNKILDKYKKHI